MAETLPGDGLPNIGSLVLQSKYAKDEATRSEVSVSLVKSLVESGRYTVLFDLSREAGIPLLAELSRNSILEAAFVACRNSGSNAPLEDVAVRQEIPLDIALCAGMALVGRYCEPYDETSLRSILLDKRYHDDVRESAGLAIGRHAVAEQGFSVLIGLVISPDVIYSVRKPVGDMLIQLAVDAGNYPALLSLNEQKALPVAIRIALEDKVEAAAKKAIELAYAEGDFALLQDISDDKRLAVSIRGRAAGCVHDLTHLKPPASEMAGLDPQMTAELMLTIGRRAGAVRSSTQPPPSDKQPLSRLKR